MNEYFPMSPYQPIYSPQSAYTWSGPVYTGIDLPTWQEVEQRARAIGQKLLPPIPTLSPSDAAKAKKYAQTFGKSLTPSLPSLPSMPHIPDVHFPDVNLPNINLPNIDASGLLGQTPQKVSDAADSAKQAADAGKDAAKQHEETMKVVKYVVIGVGALGGLALLWSIVK